MMSKKAYKIFEEGQKGLEWEGYPYSIGIYYETGVPFNLFPDFEYPEGYFVASDGVEMIEDTDGMLYLYMGGGPGPEYVNPERFQAFEYPADCFAKYDENKHVFCEVELDGDIEEKRDGNTRGAEFFATKMKIVRQWSAVSIAEGNLDVSAVTEEKGWSIAGGTYAVAAATGEKSRASARGEGDVSVVTSKGSVAAADGRFGVAVATEESCITAAAGDFGISAVTGRRSYSIAIGYRGSSSTIGDASTSTASGFGSTSTATGFHCRSYSEGDYGTSAVTGKYGGSYAAGFCGVSSATGFCGRSSVSDPTGVAVAWGYGTKARGCLGAHLLLADWRYNGELPADGHYCENLTPDNWEELGKDSWVLAGAKLVVVDGKEIKADTYYCCIGGEVIEVAGSTQEDIVSKKIYGYWYKTENEKRARGEDSGEEG